MSQLTGWEPFREFSPMEDRLTRFFRASFNPERPKRL